MKKLAIIKIITVFVIFILCSVGYILYNNWKKEIAKIPPASPSGLAASHVTAIDITLTWKDNSNNENGFVIFRNGTKLAELPANIKTYHDTSLKPATIYDYQIKAFNGAGESERVSSRVRTLNPPIKIVLERIGVHENGEEGELAREYDLLGKPGKGEEVISVLIQDEKTTVQKEYHFSAYKDQVNDIGDLVFNSTEVGDHVRIVVTSFEDDGGNTEQLIYKAMGKIATRGIDLPIAIILDLAKVDISGVFAEVFADLFASGDDFMGSYVQSWNISNDWGVGKYVDIGCPRQNGHIGIRLWFRVECPVFDYAAER